MVSKQKRLVAGLVFLMVPMIFISASGPVLPTLRESAVKPQIVASAAAAIPSSSLMQTTPSQPTINPEQIQVPVEPVPGQVIVQFTHDSTLQERQSYIDSIDGTVVEAIDSLDMFVVSVPEENAPESLPDTPAVVHSEPDYYVSALEEVDPVNDPRYAEQWALPVIGAPSAWAELPADAAKVTVAVIDSGICTGHPDLEGRIEAGWDFLENDNLPQDDFGHGCSVAGVIAANMNNSIGIAGVAPNAQIMPLRVLDGSGIGSYSDVAAAIAYAADHGAQVINLSLGGVNSSSALESAVNYALEKGVIAVAAAGNNGTEGALYPAAYPDVIAVGSIDADLQHSSFSNFGSQVDIWAPGRDILTTKRDGSYALVSGTSFAAPYVAGAEVIDLVRNTTLVLEGRVLFLGEPNVIETETVIPSDIYIPTQSNRTTTSVPTDSNNTKLFTDTIYGWSVSYPQSWQISFSFENHEAISPIIRKRVSFTTTNKELILVDVWKQGKEENLIEWFNENHAPFLSKQASIQKAESANGVISGVESILVSDPDVEHGNIPHKAAVFIHNQYVYRIEYAAINAAIDEDIFRDFLINFIVDTDLTRTYVLGALPNFPTGMYTKTTPLVTSCGSYTDNTGNPYPCNSSTGANCTWWARYKRPDFGTTGWGDAKYWYQRAQQEGYQTGRSPRKGAIAVWGEATNWSEEGHVAYVESVDSDGIAFTVSEMDWYNGGPFTNTRTIDYRPNFLGFIYTELIVCSDANFQGNCEKVRSTIQNLTGSMVGNDTISSLIVPADWGVRFWQHSYEAGKGACLRFPPVRGVRVFTDLSAKLVWEYCDVGDIANPVIGTRANDGISAIEVYQNDLMCMLDATGQCYIPPTTPTDQPQTPTPLPGTIDGLKLISVSSPTVQKGQVFSASVIYEVVSGQLLESRGDHLYGSDPTYGAWPVQPVKGTINSGQQVTFSFNLTAPQQTGTFESKWQMKIGGNLKGQQAVVRFTVQDAPQPPSGGTVVWNARYYDSIDRWWDNSNSGGFRCSETINSQFLDVNYGNGTRCGMDPDTWIGEYTSTVNFPNGNYVFYIEHDDGLKLWLNDRNIADRGGSGSSYVCPAQSVNGSAQLKVMLREDGGDARVKVYWTTDTSLCTPPKSDLTPYSRDGASQPVVAALTPGNHNQETLVAGQNAYFDWGYKNIGGSDAGPHHVKLWINGQQYIDYPFTSLGTGNLGGFDDWGITYPYSGCYPVTLTVDTEGQIDEANEGNNSWSGTMCWNPPPMPDLIPYPRSGASSPVVVSRFADFPFTDTMISGQAAFYYWGYKNVGSGNAGAHHVKIYIDNQQFIDYPFEALGADSVGGFDNWVEDFYVAPGAHQVKIVVDPNNQIAESNENNNVWSGTVYWRSPTVQITDIFTTDANGTAASLDSLKLPKSDVGSEAYKTDFNNGDSIRLYLEIDNDFDTQEPITREWEVSGPSGDIIPELSRTEVGSADAGGWWWYLIRTIPDYLVRGEYTFTGRVTYNEVTTEKSTTFVISGPPSIEAFDTYTTDENGFASSLEVYPQHLAGDFRAQSITDDFITGNSIQLYIQTYNDIADNEPATFEWAVYDPLGRYVKELSWSGDLTSPLGWVLWGLPTTIPTHAITGDYTFIGSVTYNGHTTHSTSTFHITGSASAPSNDSFSFPMIISSVPYNKTQDTWTATTAGTDPVTNCGKSNHANSNSVWYRFTSPANGFLEVNTQGSDYDTVLAVWKGTSGSLTLVQCNDDAYNTTEAWLDNVPVTSGVIYYIEVMDYGNPGGGNLKLFFDFASTPANDDFAAPITINTVPYSTSQDVRGAGKAADDPPLTACNRLAGTNSVWYKYTPSVAGQMDIDTTGSSYDTMIAVWSGSRGSLTMVGCNDDIGNVNGTYDQDSSLTVSLKAATPYYIEVSQFNGPIDTNSASAESLQGKLDIAQELGGDSALQEKKSDLENGSLDGLSSQEVRDGEVGAQLWGGQLQLHGYYHPVPNVPARVSPAEGTILSRTNNTLLDWTTNGTACTIHVWGGNLDISSEGSCSDYLLGQQPGGVYAWQVTATNAYGSITGPVWHFKVKPFGAANLQGLVFSPSQINLAWTLSSDEPADVDGYDIFKNNVQVGNVGAGIGSYSDSGLTCNTNYTYFVRSRRQTVQSDNSNSISINLPCAPTAFNKSSPLNDTANNGLKPAFRWNSSTNAAGYEYCYDTTNNNLCDTTWISVGTNLFASPTTDLLDGSTYYWQVRASNPAAQTSANGGTWWTFTTGLKPGAFTKSNPTDHAVFQPVNLTLDWSAGAQTSEYKFCIDTTNNNSCNSSWISTGFTTRASLTGLNYDTTYYWAIQALNSIGSTFADGNTWHSFTTGHLPGTLTKDAPQNLATEVPLSPTLSWASSADAESYEYCLSTRIDGCTSWINVGNLTSVNLHSLSIDTIYYWDVRSINLLGMTNASDPVRSFTTVGIPDAFSKSTPANSELTYLSPDVTITWAEAVDAESYEYCIDTTNDNDCDNNHWIVANTNTNLNLTGKLASRTIYYWQVRAVNIYGYRYANNGIWWALKTLPIPPAPRLASPIDQSATRNQTPTFTWNLVPAGSIYQIEISDSSTFTTKLQAFTGSIGEHTYTASLLQDGKYFWHVRAINVNNEASPWSNPYSLIIDTDAPAIPNLNTPADKSLVTSTTPTFLVSLSRGASQYQFQVSMDSDFSELKLDDIVPEPFNKLTADQSLLYGHYYWRVRAGDQAGNFSDWSVISEFDTIFQVSPANNSFASTAAPNFKWIAVSGASQYQLQVDNTGTFIDPEIDHYQDSGTDYTGPTMDYGVHYWRLQAYVNGAWTGWAPPLKFTLSPSTSAQPGLVSPANAALLNDSTPTLKWNQGMDDDRYEIQVDDLDTPVSPDEKFISTVGELSFTPDNLSDGLYSWRVRSLNYLGVPSPWSSTRTFQIDATPPVRPVIDSPDNNDSIIETGLFTWLASATATWYQFELDDSPDFLSPSYTSGELNTLTHTPPVMKPGVFSWHVRARDDAGNWSSWSDPRIVTILAGVPTAPVLTTPVDGSAVNDVSLDFRWNTSTSGYTYILEISTDATFTTDLKTISLGPGVVSYTVDTLSDGHYYWRVCAVNINSISGPWSNVSSVEIDTHAPASPVLVSPGDGVSAIGTRSFTWLASKTATHYQVEYDDNVDFSSPTYTSSELTTVVHLPPTLAPGIYSWHVRAADAAGNWSSWSKPRSLIVLPGVPAAPILSLPTMGALLNDATPDLQWKASLYGISYTVEISTVSTFQPVLQVLNSVPGTLSITANSLPDGTYYWRVRALNSNKNAGPWSVISSFKIDTVAPSSPILNSPEDGDEIITTSTFSWLASTGAARYQFEVDDNPDFSSPIYTSGELSTLTQTPPLMAPGVYTWHVRARDAAGNWSSWSTPRIISVLLQIPQAPALLSPMNGSISEVSSPTFEWSTPANATSFHVQIDGNSSFISPDFDETMTSTRVTSPALEDGIYYWRVSAINSAGESDWSPIWRVTIQIPIPGSPLLLMSAETVDGSSGLLTLDWASVENAFAYEIQVDNDIDFSSPIFENTGVNTYQVLDTISTTGTYFWHVRAINEAGKPGEWSDLTTLLIDIPPSAPTLSAPEAGYVSDSAAPSFIWSDVVDSASYQIQIDDDPEFTSPILEERSTSASFLTIEAIPDGTYYWRVRAFNIFDTAGDWSIGQTFQILTPPIVPTELFPEASSTLSTGFPEFSWGIVENASSYQVQVDNNLDFSAPRFDNTGTDPNWTPNEALTEGVYFWRVRAINQYGTPGEWSAPQAFTVMITVLNN